MFTYVACEYIQELLIPLRDTNGILTALGPLKYSRAKIQTAIARLFSDEDPREELKDIIGKHIDCIYQLKPREIFRKLEMLEGSARSFAAHFGDTSAIHRLHEDVGYFSEIYEDYLYHHTPQTALALFEAATTLISSLEATSETLELIQQRLLRFRHSDSDRRRLTIEFRADVDLSSLARKAEAISEIYAELAALSQTSLLEYPLEVLKVESGSFFAEVLGYPKVIDMMTDLIVRGVGYLHRSFTDEGKIGAIPKKVESVEAILNLSKSLRENGVDCTELDEGIKKAAIKIASHLNSMLCAEPEVKINEEEYSIRLEYEKLLKSGGMRSLPATSAFETQSSTKEPAEREQAPDVNEVQNGT